MTAFSAGLSTTTSSKRTWSGTAPANTGARKPVIGLTPTQDAACSGAEGEEEPPAPENDGLDYCRTSSSSVKDQALLAGVTVIRMYRAELFRFISRYLWVWSVAPTLGAFMVPTAV